MNFRIEKIQVENAPGFQYQNLDELRSHCTAMIGLTGSMDMIEKIRSDVKQPGTEVFLTFKQIDMKESYRESFHLPLPGEGTKVQIKHCEGMNFYIHWPQCPDLEDILYGWIKKKSEAEEICHHHKWQIIK